MSRVIIGKRRSGKTTEVFKEIVASQEEVCTYYTFSRESAKYAMTQFCHFISEYTSQFRAINTEGVVEIGNKKVYFKNLDISSGKNFLDEANMAFDVISLTPREKVEL